MRIFTAFILATTLTSCGALPPPSDIVIGSAVGYALFGDDLEEIKQDDLTDPKAIRGTVPPRAKDSAHRVANNVRDNVRNTAKHVKKWWFAQPKSQQQPLPVPPSYCYRVMQDIVCYQKSVPGWEARLVGYQGTLAMAPTMVKTQPLPKLDRVGKVTPEMQLKKADPIFNEIPEEIKKGASSGDAQDVSGGAQEILPDPLISPQL